jgi:hypothetical protein
MLRSCWQALTCVQGKFVTVCKVFIKLAIPLSCQLISSQLCINSHFLEAAADLKKFSCFAAALMWVPRGSSVAQKS